MDVFNSPVGFCGAVVGRAGLAALVVGFRSGRMVRRAIASAFPAPLAEARDAGVRTAVLSCLRGQPKAVEVALDLSRASDFRRKVWGACARIPFGGVVSYGSLARAVSSASSRAVGQALRHNPFPLIVPCHRVIRGDGSPGGYSASGGLRLKTWLLRMEGVPLVKGRVPRSYPGWFSL